MRKNKKTLYAVIFSIVLHFLFLVYLNNFKFDNNRDLINPNASRKKIKVTYVPRKIKKNSSLKNKNKEINYKKKQIVNSENNGKRIKPKDSRFLGEKNQTFSKQTVAKSVGQFKKAGSGVEGGINKKVKSKSLKSSPSSAVAKNNSSRSSTRSKKVKRPVNLANLGVGLNAKSPILNNPNKDMKLLGTKTGIGKSPGLGRNNDYVKDIPLGSMTNLNTVEFKYFGFYSRIRKQLEQYWGYSLRQKAKKLYQQGRSLSHNEEYITSLKITIDGKGNILQVIVISSSGLEDLDAAAVESFNKAGPFPNPPQGMLSDGRATLEWGFVVKS